MGSDLMYLIYIAFIMTKNTIYMSLKKEEEEKTTLTKWHLNLRSVFSSLLRRSVLLSLIQLLITGFGGREIKC